PRSSERSTPRACSTRARGETLASGTGVSRRVAAQLHGGAVDAAAVLVQLEVRDPDDFDAAPLEQLGRARRVVGHDHAARTHRQAVDPPLLAGVTPDRLDAELGEPVEEPVGSPGASTSALSLSTIPRWASMWIENPPIGTTISSIPIRARSSRSWSAASALQRIDVPNAATRGVNLTNVPPSSIPAPMIVWRIGIPSAATARVTLASSPRRMSGAIRPITTPPGTDTSGSRV